MIQGTNTKMKLLIHATGFAQTLDTKKNILTQLDQNTAEYLL